VWPRSPRMAYGGGNGGIRCSPEPLDHRRWIGGVEGGAVEEKVQRSGVDEKRNGAKRGNERRPTPFMVARQRGMGQGGPGSALRGGRERGRERGPRARRGTARAAGNDPQPAGAGSAVATR
jgi:hypothetical protein